MSQNRKYTVQALDAAGTATDTGLAHSKKDSAISLARGYRADERTAVQVLSPSGAEVVFSMAAPTTDRVIRNKTTMFTRTVSIPEDAFGEGVELPAGFTPAYFRPRTSLALLRADDRTAEHTYLLFNVATGESEGFSNCTSAEAVMKARYEAVKAEGEAAREAEKVAKAEAKAEAKAAREAEKARKAAEREEAKAAREAEKAEKLAAKEAAELEAKNAELVDA